MKFFSRDQIYYRRRLIRSRLRGYNIPNNVPAEQYAYGNLEHLRRYAEIEEESLYLNAVLHHANHLSSVQNEFFDELSITGDPLIHLISSKLELKASQERIRGTIIPIGSPWVYFCKLNEIDIESCLEEKNLQWSSFEVSERIFSSKKILYLPSHSSMISSTTNYFMFEKFLKTVRGKHKDLSVCLGWLDFCTKSVREFFASKGIQTTTAGIAYHSIPDFPGGDRLNFYQNLLSIFLDVDLVIADHYTNGLLYAASIGIPVGLLDYEHSLCQTTSNFKSWNNCLGNQIKKELLQHTPFFLKRSEPRIVREQLIDWLGIRNVLSPDEIRELPWITKNREKNY